MTERRSSPYPSTHPGARHGDPDEVGLARLLARIFLIVVPAQIIGILIGGQIVMATDQLGQNPGLANLITVTSGAVSGLALGLVLSPGARGRLRHLVASAVIGLVLVVLLLVAAHLRQPVGSVGAPWTAYVLGPLLLVGVQSVVAWGLWEIKTRKG